MMTATFVPLVVVDVVAGWVVDALVVVDVLIGWVVNALVVDDIVGGGVIDAVVVVDVVVGRIVVHRVVVHRVIMAMAGALALTMNGGHVHGLDMVDLGLMGPVVAVVMNGLSDG